MIWPPVEMKAHDGRVFHAAFVVGAWCAAVLVIACVAQSCTAFAYGISLAKWFRKVVRVSRTFAVPLAAPGTCWTS